MANTQPSFFPQGIASTMSEVPSPSLTIVRHSADVATLNREVIGHLNERGYVAYHPKLAGKLDFKAALFLSSALYWTRLSLRKRPQSAGWFWMSAQDWQKATALSRREQETIRGKLVACGLLEEMLMGRPPVMHYKIRLDALAAVLDVPDLLSGNGKLSVDAAQQWFRNCISYFKPLADITGSAASGLYLSYLLQRQREAALRGHLHADILAITNEQAEAELCLGAKTLRNTRSRLKACGIIQDVAGLGGIRLNLDAVLACLRGQNTKPLLPPTSPVKRPLQPVEAVVKAKPTLAVGCAVQQPLNLLSPMPTAAKPVVPVQTEVIVPVAAFHRGDLVLGFLSADSHVENRQIDVQAIHLPSSEDASIPVTGGVPKTPNKDAQNAKSGVPKSPYRGAQNAKFGVPKSPYHYQRGITNTTTTTTQDEVDTCRSRRLDDELIWPAGIDPTLVGGIEHVLQAARQEHRQALLDELDGQMRLAGKVIHNPAGWLRGLIHNVTDTDALAFARRVAAEREAAAQKTVQSQEQQPRAVVSPPSPEVAERLRNVRRQIASKGVKP